MIATLWGIIAPVFLCAAVGYVWGRTRRPFDAEMVSTLVITVTTPCLIVATLGNTDISLAALSQVALLVVVVLLLSAAIACAILHLSGHAFRIFLPSLIFPNAGNMGIPLCMLAFGQEGLALALAWMMLYAVIHFSVGLSIVSQQPLSPALLRHPILLSVLLAVVMVATDVSLPAWLQTSMQMIGNVTIPLMLLTLGVSLSQMRLHHLGAGAFFAVLRLLIGFGVGWLVVTMFALEGAMRGVVLIESSMPVAVFNYLLAKSHNQGAEEVAAMVVVSTLAAFLVLPFLLTFAL